MTLFQIIQILKQIALTQPNIKSATDGSIYDIMNTNPSVKYDVVHFSQTTHQSDEETDYYGLNIFYVSRLEDSLEDNRLQIQSIGKEVLDNIIRTFCENWNIDFPVITYTPFTQKFNDLCAGCYCNLRLEIPKEIICADDYIAEVVSGSGIKLQDIGITITQNGLIVITPDAEYDGIGEIRIETDVPQSTANLQYKEVEYDQNGEYTVQPDSNYDGLSEIAITVNIPQGEGYEEGYEDGVADQKAKLSAITISANGQYDRADGYSAITVNVPSSEDRYEEGYEDGYAAGEAAQKAKLVTTSVTENGLYHRENGYSTIYVNVPDRDLIANLQGDYYVIPPGTTHLRDYAFYRTCFSSMTIPNSVSAIGEYSFAYNSCLKELTFGTGLISMDDNAIFACTNLEQITFNGLTPPTIATGSSLDDPSLSFPIYVPCQSLSAYQAAFGSLYAPRIQCLTPPGPEAHILDFVYSTNTENQMVTLFIGEAQMDSAYFYKFYNGLISMEIDGVVVEKDSSQISHKQADIAYYWHSFPTPGSHTVKYYVSTADTGHSATILQPHLFADSQGYAGIKLTEANIEEGYTTIGAGAFQGTTSLTSLTIPSSVTGIGEYICNYCRNLTTVTCLATTPPFMTEDLGYGYEQFDHTSLQNIYVPAASVEAYKAAPGWSKYANKITAITP